MCNPLVIAIASKTLLLGTAGTALAAAGQVSQGIAANKAGKANARIQTILAEDAISRGAAREASQRRRTAARKGRQAAVFGASGAEINTGSSLEILADTAQFGELEALRIRSNAEREAFGLLSGAAISRAEGQNLRTSAFLSAAGTVLTGASKVSSKWQVFKADNPSATFGNFLGFGDIAPEEGILTTGAPI